MSPDTVPGGRGGRGVGMVGGRGSMSRARARAAASRSPRGTWGDTPGVGTPPGVRSAANNTVI